MGAAIEVEPRLEWNRNRSGTAIRVGSITDAVSESIATRTLLLHQCEGGVGLRISTMEARR